MIVERPAPGSLLARYSIIDSARLLEFAISTEDGVTTRYEGAGVEDTRFVCNVFFSGSGRSKRSRVGFLTKVLVK